MQTYQLAFKLQFEQNFTRQQIQIEVGDGNTFQMQGDEGLQLLPYLDDVMPPLLSFSMSNQLLSFNIDSGSAGQCIQCVAWASFSDASNGAALRLYVEAPTGLVAVYYTVLGTASSGVLQSGENTIFVT